MMGSLNQQVGDYRQAEKDYRNAIKVESNIAGPRTNLALLLDAKLRVMKTEAERERAVEEIKNLRREENRLLKVDVERAKDLPNTHSLHYSYAMSCYLQDDLETATKHLQIALDQQPKSEQYLQAMTLILEKMEQFEKAGRMVDRLLELAPDNIGYQQLKKRILQNLKKE